MTTTRQQKVNSLLKTLVSSYLLREKPEGITGLLTITKADSTPNLKHAKIYFSVVGQDEQEVLSALNKNIYQVQGMLNKSLEMKFVPRISFVPDRGLEHAQRISKIIQDIYRDKNRGAA